MGYLTLRDNSGKTEAVIFSDDFKKYEEDLYEGNTGIFTGERSRKGDSLMIKKIKTI